MLIKEKWKDVKGYAGLYQVSNFGRVRSLDRTYKVSLPNTNQVTRKGKILKPNLQNNGYVTVTLSKSGTSKMFSVHRLVASAFISEPYSSLEVNHKDGNKTNNHVSNLEWVSRSENQKHRFRVLGHQETTKKSIYCHDLDLKTDSIMAMNDILYSLGISSKTSYSVLAKYAREKGKTFKYKGLVFTVE